MYQQDTGSITIPWTYEDHDDENIGYDFELQIDYYGWEEDDGTAHDYYPPRTFMVYEVQEIYCDNKMAEDAARKLYAEDRAFREWLNEEISERIEDRAFREWLNEEISERIN